MSKKGTYDVKILQKQCVKVRIVSVDKYNHVADHFFNQRLLNQFKKLLRSSEIEYSKYSFKNTVVVDRFNLVISRTGPSRFSAKNKACFMNLTFSFEARSCSELIIKLLRFRIIGIGAAKQICGEDVKILKKEKKDKLQEYQDQKIPLKQMRDKSGFLPPLPPVKVLKLPKKECIKVTNNQ